METENEFYTYCFVCDEEISADDSYSNMCDRCVTEQGLE